MSYNPVRLKSCDIHTDMGFNLVPQSLKIPRQMGYTTQSNESSAVPHEKINVPIGNISRLLLADTPTY